MKKIYDKRCLIRVNGEKDFHETSIFYHLSYLEEEETQTIERVFTDFQKAYEYVENDGVMNARTGRTIFCNKPEIKLSTVDSARYYTEKNFKSLAVRWEYVEVNPTMKSLAGMLTADEFCEYLADRGITKI